MPLNPKSISLADANFSCWRLCFLNSFLLANLLDFQDVLYCENQTTEPLMYPVGCARSHPKINKKSPGIVTKLNQELTFGTFYLYIHLICEFSLG